MTEKKKYTSRFGASTVGKMANPDGGGLSIQFYSLGTGQRAEFAAFVSDFTDSFASNWNQQQIFGRMDPVMNIIGTTRNLSLSFSVPAYSLAGARSNLAEVNKLAQFLYPTYRTAGSHSTVKGNPLVKVQFQNLIASGKNSLALNKAFDLDSSKNGLIVAITSLSYSPDFEQGVLGAENSGMQFPKVWNVNMSMQVLHDHTLDAKRTKNMGFPYMSPSQASLNPQNTPDKKKEKPIPEAKTPTKVNGEEVSNSAVQQGAPAQKQGGSAAIVPSAAKPNTPGSAILTDTTYVDAGVPVEGEFTEFQHKETEDLTNTVNSLGEAMGDQYDMLMSAYLVDEAENPSPEENPYSDDFLTNNYNEKFNKGD